jgi:hypothetical protein
LSGELGETLLAVGLLAFALFGAHGFRRLAVPR